MIGTRSKTTITRMTTTDKTEKKTITTKTTTTKSTTPKTTKTNTNPKPLELGTWKFYTMFTHLSGIFLLIFLFLTILNYSLNVNAMHHTSKHYTSIHCTTLHFTTLHCTTLHCHALHCTAISFFKYKMWVKLKICESYVAPMLLDHKGVECDLLACATQYFWDQKKIGKTILTKQKQLKHKEGGEGEG